MMPPPTIMAVAPMIPVTQPTSGARAYMPRTWTEMTQPDEPQLLAAVGHVQRRHDHDRHHHRLAHHHRRRRQAGARQAQDQTQRLAERPMAGRHLRTPAQAPSHQQRIGPQAALHH